MSTVFQFSGGKDSLVCLHLLKPRLSEITVLWMNAGAPFPETRALMDEVRAQVPHFVEVTADVTKDMERNGLPVDVLPVKATRFGKGATVNDAPLMRTWIECCRDNVWLPMHQKTKELGATVIIRGQRNAESYKSPVRHGDVIDGIRHEFPVQDWTDREIDEYLAKHQISVPDHYRYTKKSLDCWNCTAFLDEKRGVFEYMKLFHQSKYAQVQANLRKIRDATLSEFQFINDVTQ